MDLTKLILPLTLVIDLIGTVGRLLKILKPKESKNAPQENESPEVETLVQQNGDENA